MKHLKLAIILLAASLIQFSCEKDKDEDAQSQSLNRGLGHKRKKLN